MPNDLELVVEVRQRPLRSGARSCGLAVPTAIRSSQLRSGSAHSDLGLAVEVRTDGRKDEEAEEVSLIEAVSRPSHGRWGTATTCLQSLVQHNNSIKFTKFVTMFSKNNMSNWALWATSLVWLSQRPAGVFAQATQNGPPIQAGTWNIL